VEGNILFGFREPMSSLNASGTSIGCIVEEPNLEEQQSPNNWILAPASEIIHVERIGKWRKGKGFLMQNKKTAIKTLIATLCVLAIILVIVILIEQGEFVPVFNWINTIGTTSPKPTLILPSYFYKDTTDSF
jgi:hypothetical protein